LIRDPGPQRNLGYGILSRDLPVGDDDKQGPDPYGSFIGRALHDDPILKFFAVGAATLVSMHVAGQLVKKGGIKVGRKLLDANSSPLPKVMRSTLVNDFIKIRDTLDDWEGVTRVKGPADAGDPEGLFGSTVISRTGFAYRKGDRGAEWTLRDEVQQRLIRQARRLPYELPAAYAAQRLPGVGTDAIFGTDQERPDWGNPVDVLSDFANQSAKNLVSYLIPFEAGGAAVKQGWRRILTHQEGIANPQVQNAAVSLNMSLNLIGHKASDILYDMAMKSQRSASAIGAGIKHAVDHTKPLPFHLRDSLRSSSQQGLRQAAKDVKAEDVYGVGRYGITAGMRRIGRPFLAGKYFREAYLERKVQFNKEWAHLEGIRAGKRPGIDMVMIDGREEVLDASLARNIRESSRVEQIADNIIHYGGRQAADPNLQSLSQGQFFSDQMDMEYKNYLIRAMEESKIVREGGIPKEDIADYVQALMVKQRPRPGARNYKIPVTDRFGFGSEEILAGTSKEWFDELGQSMSHMRHGKPLTEAFSKSIRDADNAFLEGYEDTAIQVYDRWRVLYNRGLVPFATRHLGQSRLPAESFENLQNEDVLDYLVRNTADRINRAGHLQHGRTVIPLKRAIPGIGERRASFEEVAAELAPFGFTPNDPKRMLQFLTEEGVVARPGSQNAFNIFGMRRLSIEDALGRGYFAGDREREHAIRMLARNMSDFSETGAADWLRRTPVGDVIETRSGQIIDLSPITSSFRKVVDKFADNFQIPFLHIKPLPTAGYNAARSRAETPIFQIQGGGAATRQPFVPKTQAEAEAWLFTRDRRAKGRYSMLYRDEMGIRRLQQKQGWFTAMATDADSMLGRHVRLAIGDKGQNPTEQPTGWRRYLNVDPDQPKSLLRLFKRARMGKTDVRNPAVLSQMILDANGDIDDIARKAGVNRSEVAQGFKDLENHLRQFQIKPDAIRQLVHSSDPRVRKMLEIKDPVTDRTLNLATMQGEGDISASIRILKDVVTDTADDNLRLQLRRTYNAYIRPHERGSRSPGYFNQPSSKTLRRRGIHTRAEEVKADIGRFLAVSQGLEIGSADFSEVLDVLLRNLDDMKRAGSLNRADYTESRAAVLGLQISFTKVSQFSQSQNAQSRILEAMQISTSTTTAKAVLGDVARYETEGGFLGFIGRGARRRFPVSPYRYEGTEYNPFAGGQGSVMVPTFGSVLSQHPARAVSSALGFTNWSDPEAFSGASVVSGHLFQRLNDFMSLAGMQLDETAYRGSMDFYARGLVGQRVLPIAAGGAALFAADRTIGGAVNERDEEGNRVYSPYFMGKAARGVVELQAQMASALPGGMTGAEKREELLYGEVPIRKGRWWPLGNTPWEGGRISYYRPSWYRRFTSGAGYVPEAGYDTPMERLAFGYDFSPLRPLDPYRFERQTGDIRPYPVTGQYFNGPWGPLTSALNMSIGKILKPEVRMHEEQVDYYLSRAQLVGAGGVAPNQELEQAQAAVLSSVGGTAVRPVGASIGGGGAPGGRGGPKGSSVITGGPGGSYGGRGGGVGGDAQKTLALLDQAYYEAAEGYPGTNSAYGVSSMRGAFPPAVIPGGVPITPGSFQYQAGQLGYQAQELAGIYGFAFGALRTSLGMGDQDMNPQVPVLESPTSATSMGRAFWEQSFGGIGDLPLPIEGDYSNLEISEFARRFLTRERSGVNEINPLPNQMGIQNPWLPGSDYFVNFRQGDPYAAVPEGLSRLPGTGYRRFNQLHPDETGQYGVIDQHKILADVAPWSDEYRAIDRKVDSYIRTPQDRALVNQTRRQVIERRKEFDFSPYEYSNTDYQTVQARVTGVGSGGQVYTDAFDNPVGIAGVIPNGSFESEEAINSLIDQTVSLTYDRNRPVLATDRDEPIQALIRSGGRNFNQQLIQSGLADLSGDDTALLNADESMLVRQARRLGENLAHKDTPFNKKFFPSRTATEDWERNNVYGATFPQWQHPVKDYLMPAVYKATNRNPILSGVALAGLGSMFGVSPQAKVVGSLVGGITGVVAGSIRGGEEALAGERFIPLNRKKEVAVEEYIDILSYIRAMKNRNEAVSAGNTEAAKYFTQQAQKTMYGADVYSDPDRLASALPERKRRHFEEMIRAPISDRNRILSTAGRLERRLYQAAWGMDVEQRPDLAEYFDDRELPGPDWEGWNPDVSMDAVKIKVAQNMGLDVAQMGYYPQQVRAANAINPAYPDITDNSISRRTAEAQLRKLLYDQGISGNVRMINTPYPGTRVQLNAGVA
jgi:hypothetical protein